MIFQSPQQLNPAGLIVWVAFFVIGLFLISKKKVSNKFTIPILGLSLILGGILFGAIPNPIMPIQQIFIAMGVPIPIATLMPMIIILVVLLLTAFFFGRAFCGYACPLGVLQELASKIRYKSKYSKKNPKLLHMKKIYSKIIQYTFLVIFGAVGIVWGASVIQMLNPFGGFKIFTNPYVPAFLIPIILLSVIFIVSFFYYRPWCQLFCPYGALTSIVSRFSRYKLRRTDDCNQCELCEKICPTGESFADSVKDECYMCGRCIDICPKDAIELSKAPKK